MGLINKITLLQLYINSKLDLDDKTKLDLIKELIHIKSELEEEIGENEVRSISDGRIFYKGEVYINDNLTERQKNYHSRI